MLDNNEFENIFPFDSSLSRHYTHVTMTHTCPFLSPTSNPSCPAGPPITLMYLINDSIAHSLSFTP